MANGTDYFNANPTFGGAFAMDEATLTFAAGAGNDVETGLGQLVQQMQVQYSRPVQRIFELGMSKATYYVVGRAEGNISISRLAAPGTIQDDFIQKFSDICRVPNNTFNVTPSPGVDCDDDAAVNVTGENFTPITRGNVKVKRFQFDYCLVTGIQFSMDVKALGLTENMSMIFAKMSSHDEGSLKDRAQSNQEDIAEAVNEGNIPQPPLPPAQVV